MPTTPRLSAHHIADARTAIDVRTLVFVRTSPTRVELRPSGVAAVELIATAPDRIEALPVGSVFGARRTRIRAVAGTHLVAY